MMRMMNMHLHLIRIHCSMVRDAVLFNMVNPDLLLIPGRPCNEQGEYLPPHTPPPPPTEPAEAEPHNPWSPFDSRIEFDFAHYHFDHSTIACFYAPSDLCGAGGMYRECIH